MNPREAAAAGADLARLYRDLGVLRPNGVTTSQAAPMDDMLRQASVLQRDRRISGNRQPRLVRLSGLHTGQQRRAGTRAGQVAGCPWCTPTGGDPFTVNVGQYHLDKGDAPYANRHAASLRAIHDLSNLDNSRFIYQTGQSGNVFSSRYRDMSETWAAKGHRVLTMNPAEWRSTLELRP